MKGTEGAGAFMPRTTALKSGAFRRGPSGFRSYLEKRVGQLVYGIEIR
jgi:hypothetical protein